jgi:hypothetical protein
MLGDCYPAEFFRDIKNARIRSALTQIADETQEDLEYFESVLKDFGCEVLRPNLDKSDSIMNYIDENGEVQGRQGVPRSPLQPRDAQLVLGTKCLATSSDHSSIADMLLEYSNKTVDLRDPDAVSFKDSPYWKISSAYSFPIGKKFVQSDTNIPEEYFKDFDVHFHKFDGHTDANFHPIKPGAILSLHDVQNYSETFPGWDVCYLPDQSWEKVDGFLKIKEQVGGKWWVPDQEDNDEFTNFVETWLNDWVGYAEETVFDVNVLVLDEKHVCVSQQNNGQVNKFLKKHGMEPVYIPWRHRYFWDGGLHCITLDLYREGIQQDYFKG